MTPAATGTRLEGATAIPRLPALTGGDGLV